MDKKEIEKQINDLKSIRDEYRHTTFKFKVAASKRLIDHRGKIAELCLTIGVAILPIVSLVEGNINPAVLASSAIFVGSGIYGLWWLKKYFERDVNELHGGVGLEDQEIMQEIIDGRERLLDNKDDSTTKVLNEIRDNEQKLVVKMSGLQSDRKIDYSLDVVYVLFTLAWILLLKNYWIYSQEEYWISFSIVAIIVIINICRSYSSAVDSERKSRKYKKHDRERILNKLTK